MTPKPQASNTGRLDVLILRLSEELGHRIHAQTRIDVRESLKEVANNLIEDMGIPRSPIDANRVVRNLFRLPNRSGGSRRTGVSARRKLRRVV